MTKLARARQNNVIANNDRSSLRARISCLESALRLMLQETDRDNGAHASCGKDYEGFDRRCPRCQAWDAAHEALLDD